MEDLNPTKREEEFLRGIKLAASGEDSSVPTPVWDYEKRLYDIWLAAKGEDPIYNLPVRTEHPDAFYNAIRDALVEGGGGGGITPTGTIDIAENGTVDVTEYATANVNVSGYKILKEFDLQVQHQGPTETTVDQRTLSMLPIVSGDVYGKIIYIKVRNKAGMLKGHVYGSDNYFRLIKKGNYNEAVNGITSAIITNPGATRPMIIRSSSEDGSGVWISAISYSPANSPSMQVTVKAKSYISTVSQIDIDDEFAIQAYLLGYPDGSDAINPT